MSYKSTQDKEKLEYPWTARQKRDKIGRGAKKRDKKMQKVKIKKGQAKTKPK